MWLLWALLTVAAPAEEPAAAAEPSFTRLTRDMRLGRHAPEQMVEHWDAFIAANPHSPMLDDAQLNRLFALGSYRQDGETLRQIDAFVATEPREDLRVDAQLMSVAIRYEALGDCEGVKQATTALLTATDGREAGYISAIAGLCETDVVAKRVHLERAMQLGLDNRRIHAEVVKAPAAMDHPEARGGQ